MTIIERPAPSEVIDRFQRDAALAYHDKLFLSFARMHALMGTVGQVDWAKLGRPRVVDWSKY